MSSSTVTYTSIYFDSEPWRFQWVPGPEHPPSPDYVLDPEYKEYVSLLENEVPTKDQPLPTDASPTALSSGYVVDSDPEEDEDKEDKEHLASGDSTVATPPPPPPPR
ncbi:hypothetical protein Tco_0838308 [Tanacetum coccineum]|uniref:Uncharacterized protein n=1 Tax=Tanacetum coccineum TaxID=301880 RepID=A0ABQ5AME3_9ASTR